MAAINEAKAIAARAMGMATSRAKMSGEDARHRNIGARREQAPLTCVAACYDGGDLKAEPDSSYLAMTPDREFRNSAHQPPDFSDDWSDEDLRDLARFCADYAELEIHGDVRKHSAFLRGYVPEDEGLYDDYSAG
jgi:hypothetical protein